MPRVPPEASLQESEQPRRDLAGDQIDWPLPKKSGRDALAGLLHARRIPKLRAASPALRPCKPERHIAQLRGRSPGNWNPSVRSLHTYRSVAAATGAAARIARCVNPKSLEPCNENLRRFRFSPLLRSGCLSEASVDIARTYIGPGGCGWAFYSPIAVSPKSLLLLCPLSVWPRLSLHGAPLNLNAAREGAIILANLRQSAHGEYGSRG